MITDFLLLREDGKIIDEGITVDRMSALGWKPSLVVEARWKWGGESLSLANPLGLLAIVVPDRERLAILLNTDESRLIATLHVVDGSTQSLTKIPDRLAINDKLEEGTFSWLEYFPHDSKSVFSCMYTKKRDQAIYRVDIDAISGSVLLVQPSR
ncbi:hypothetical protein [Stenotrophomonas sp. 364]|uniref:hypothetical protein n=1 Tax=Stenotrophomonas sp. 364 TaxID=2691571 RepID=UPI001316A209|nr:hypothetical protein [Stenotrophomonas sp. 364]QHB70637.1 hypothetical protein GQ674_04570 [Stenotrophomonas sp. 364]